MEEKPSRKFPKGGRKAPVRRDELPKVDEKVPQSMVGRAKRVLIARTGMTPLDFLVAVYRNELFDDYDRWLAEDGKTYFYVPKSDAKHLTADMEQRISAARAAAPYLHKKMPIGIEDTRGTAAVIPMEKLAQLSDAELDTLLKVMNKIGLGLPPDPSDQRDLTPKEVIQAEALDG